MTLGREIPPPPDSLPLLLPVYPLTLSDVNAGFKPPGQSVPSLGREELSLVSIQARCQQIPVVS